MDGAGQARSGRCSGAADDSGLPGIIIFISLTGCGRAYANDNADTESHPTTHTHFEIQK